MRHTIQLGHYSAIVIQPQCGRVMVESAHNKGLTVNQALDADQARAAAFALLESAETLERVAAIVEARALIDRCRGVA